jgi:hypothetical protein
VYVRRGFPISIPHLGFRNSNSHSSVARPPSLRKEKTTVADGTTNLGCMKQLIGAIMRADAEP